MKKPGFTICIRKNTDSRIIIRLNYMLRSKLHCSFKSFTREHIINRNCFIQPNLSSVIIIIKYFCTNQL